MQPSQISAPANSTPAISTPATCSRTNTLTRLLTDLQACRHRTLCLVDGITPMVLNRQAHSEFSPLGWHLGHIAYTEAFWMLDEHARAQISKHMGGDYYDILFAADGLPKSERQNLPPLAELLRYLAAVRCLTLEQITREQDDQASLRPSLRLLHWLLQHEGQHAETMAMVIAMHQQRPQFLLKKLPDQVAVADDALGIMVLLQGGEFVQGADADWAIDNEKPAHRVRVDDFWIDKNLVSCRQFAQFMAMGGYQKEQWWSKAGWAWQQKAQVAQPRYWSDDAALGNKPVCGVSWYEADAYARSLDKRLPTEPEWEKAALSGACLNMFGSVWQWTNTWFDGYPEFQAFPYAGYSQAYFDGEHRVLKGGSWASPDSIIRKSFRNWYHPHRRELFAGFRCAQSTIPN